MVEALAGFVTYLQAGSPFMVRKGDRFLSSDPVVKKHADSFGDVTYRSSGAPRSTTVEATETATAEPGARRTPSRATKKGEGDA